MRLEDFRKSDNVEDERDSGPSGGGFPLGGAKLGGGALIVIVIVSLVLGVNPLTLLDSLDTGSATSPPAQPAPGYGPQYGPGGAARPGAPPDAAADLPARVLGDTEDVWTAVFQTMGSRYVPPTLVLFNGSVQSACGRASAAVGPFYCSANRKLYLDTAFFDELARRFHAPGDFAQAYVIAHEVGHHVQNATGIMQKFDAQSARQDERGRNALSVRLELQADCYAGVWGYFAQKRNKLDVGDLEEGFAAAAAVGDDRIQKQSRGYVVPDSFTHGSAAQRQYWFKVGLAAGDMRRCDTFATREP